MQADFEEGYVNTADPSVLRFLIASRSEVTAQQLRDDLLSMLVAGHETTGSALTWTLYLLAQNPHTMAKVRPLTAAQASQHSAAHYHSLSSCRAEASRTWPSIP